jgi:hypothetical protein
MIFVTGISLLYLFVVQYLFCCDECVAPSKKIFRHLGSKALKKDETESVPGFEELPL